MFALLLSATSAHPLRSAPETPGHFLGSENHHLPVPSAPHAPAGTTFAPVIAPLAANRLNINTNPSHLNSHNQRPPAFNPNAAAAGSHASANRLNINAHPSHLNNRLPAVNPNAAAAGSHASANHNTNPGNLNTNQRAPSLPGAAAPRLPPNRRTT
jgi:hypothetical protein